MKKLRLTVDDLRVDTFVTAESIDPRGTVHGHISCRCTNAQGGTCGGGASCNGGATCDTDCSGITYVDSCPCEPETVYDPSCDYTCVETCHTQCVACTGAWC
ncbi:MAG TPA: hypothetical protein VHG91_07750 [Longimicrobium sp.]|nr:hypothetical protein [Longimicrobium sp.]